jgi:2-keto-3-deoxy-6-phosphogluconate aldolase
VSERTGQIVLPTEPGERLEAACRIAGALAEAGVQELELAEADACVRRRLTARGCDLPRIIASARPGTTLSGAGVSVLIEAGTARFVATGLVSERLGTG